MGLTCKILGLIPPMRRKELNHHPENLPKRKRMTAAGRRKGKNEGGWDMII